MVRMGLWAFGKKTIKVKFLPFLIILEGTCCRTCLTTSEVNLDQLSKAVFAWFFHCKMILHFKLKFQSQ